MIIHVNRPPVVFGMGQDEMTPAVVNPPEDRFSNAMTMLRYGLLAFGAYLIWGAVKHRGR